MEIFTYDGVELLVRWVHILAGITWIGLLYYFNFVQGPFFNQTDPDVKATATRQLVPRALWWFRYSALLTWLAGVTLILLHISQEGWENWTGVLTRPGPQGLPILSGMILGTLMFLNVWGVIWPNQQIVIASAEATSAGREADPGAAGATRRALLASRTNVLFSVPMLFFMATSSHLLLARTMTFGQKVLYALIGGAIVALLEVNALVGTGGPAKQPLETVRSVIVSGFVLWGVLYVILQFLSGG
jgi:uncharacterized membrane protein